MTTQHTPGPWIVSPKPGYMGAKRIQHPDALSDIALAWGEADARLIAAAPELATLCDELRATCGMLQDELSRVKAECDTLRAERVRLHGMLEVVSAEYLYVMNTNDIRDSRQNGQNAYAIAKDAVGDDT